MQRVCALHSPKSSGGNGRAKGSSRRWVDFGARLGQPPRVLPQRFVQVERARPRVRCWTQALSSPLSTPWNNTPVQPHPQGSGTSCLQPLQLRNGFLSFLQSLERGDLKRNCSLCRETFVLRYFSLITVFARGVGAAIRLVLVQGVACSVLSGRVWTRRVRTDRHRAGLGSWALLCSQLGRSCRQEGQTMKTLVFLPFGSLTREIIFLKTVV